ncbi:MAG: permease-like cell division protein FtsX [Mizugakiibacter sp.]|uniref:permease-like cell division protein FtsX n=1 Tax=Mizugakiibacter sp. TaxID=1972610 RepID=UPI0031C8009E|nr:permease-like cell division protein FtsX [Xanthomonadaceae bacterium]
MSARRRDVAAAARAEPAARPASRGRLRAWREQHAWCFAASVRRLAERPLGTLLTVAVMGFALALPLAFYLLLGNVQRLGAALGETQAISVFLKADRDAQAAQALAARLRGRVDVAAVALKTPQQGLQELAALEGFAPALDALGSNNPLPYVLLVEPRPELARAAVTTLVETLRTLPEADLVQDDGAWRERLGALVGVARRAVQLLAVLLALAALLVVGNTVRLDIRSRADEIAVLQLVGASAAFVRRPYLYEGIWYGLCSGAFAALLVLLLELALAGPVARLAGSYGGQLSFAGIALPVLLMVPLLAAALGWLGARLASARHLGATLPR